MRATQAFLEQRKEQIAPVNESGARKDLDDLVDQFTTQSIDQKAGSANAKGETAMQVQLRGELRLTHMAPIAAIAQARLRDVPEMRAFRLPTAATPTTRLIADAGAMRDAAALHQPVFIQAGQPQDFIAQLEAATDALMASLTTRKQSLGNSKGATAALAALGKQGRAIIRILNTMVAPKLRLNDRLLGEWLSIKKVGRKRGPASGGVGSTSASGTAVTPITVPVGGSATPVVPTAGTQPTTPEGASVVAEQSAA